MSRKQVTYGKHLSSKAFPWVAQKNQWQSFTHYDGIILSITAKGKRIQHERVFHYLLTYFVILKPHQWCVTLGVSHASVY